MNDRERDRKLLSDLLRVLLFFVFADAYGYVYARDCATCACASLRGNSPALFLAC